MSTKKSVKDYFCPEGFAQVVVKPSNRVETENPI